MVAAARPEMYTRDEQPERLHVVAAELRDMEAEARANLPALRAFLRQYRPIPPAPAIPVHALVGRVRLVAGR